MIRAALVMLAMAAAARGQSPADLAALEDRILKERVHAETARMEADALAAALAPSSDARRLPPSLSDAVAKALTVQYEAIRTAPAGTADAFIAKEWQATQARYDAIVLRQIAFRREIDHRQREEGIDWANRSTPGFAPTWFDAVLLPVFAVGLFFSLKWAAKELRVERRHLLRMGALAVLVPMIGGCDGEKPALFEKKEAARLERELATAMAEAAEAQKKTLTARTAAIERWANALDGTAAKTVRDREPEALAKLADLLYLATLAERQSTLADDGRVALETETAALTALRSANRWEALGFLGLRIAVAAGLAVLAVWPYRRALARRRRQRESDAATCPRCLTAGWIVQSSDRRIAECRACEYRFSPADRSAARLCFAAIGVRGAGKTHLLTTAYAAAKRGAMRGTARMAAAPSLGDERFAVYIELVLKRRGVAGPTVHGHRAEDLPYPVILTATDADPAGANAVAVNLFDFSGDVLAEGTDADPLRRRALRMDGVLLVFDPTQLYGSAADGALSVEDQWKAIAEFAHDLRAAQGRTVPVAVCLSKFDEVAQHTPMGGQALPFLEHLRTGLNPPGPVTLDLLRKRSALAEQMLPFMLPGFDLPTLVRERFGGPCLFFPASDRGFAASVPGRDPAALRPVPVPFGVTEPILWLLHMAGYEVLAENENVRKA